MVLTIVQPNAKTIYLKLWKLEIISGSKPQWIFKQSLIPYEVDDTRFRRSCDLLADGWRFYLVKADPKRGDRPVLIPSELLAAIAKDAPTYPQNAASMIDFDAHWKEVDKLYDLAQKTPKGVALTAKTGLERLVKDYHAGKKLKSFQLTMIKDLI